VGYELARLTSEIISEVAEHRAADGDPAGHHDKSGGTWPRS
jgi:hypothetical protein